MSKGERDMRVLSWQGMMMAWGPWEGGPDAVIGEPEGYVPMEGSGGPRRGSGEEEEEEEEENDEEDAGISSSSSSRPDRSTSRSEEGSRSPDRVDSHPLPMYV